MNSIFSAYESAKENAIRGDFIDRLHSRYTVILLTAIIILLGLKQSDGDTIQCWLPPTFSDEQSLYSHQLCWVNNTYHYPDQNDADKFSQSPKLVIKYYQFILFILFIQTLLFSIPTYLWGFMSSSSGGYIKKLLDQTQKSKVIDKLVELEKEKIKKKEEDEKAKKEKEEKNLKNDESLLTSSRAVNEEKEPEDKEDEELKIVAPQIETDFMSAFKSLNRAVIDEEGSAETKQLLKVSVRGSPGKKSPFYRNISKGVGRVLSGMKPISGLKNLVFHYMSLKVLNLINVLGQIFFLHYFVFERHFISYGFEFVSKLLNSENPFYLTDIFPIVTYCDFYVHQNLRQIHWYTAQCILGINIFIEKLFMVIWFWLFLLAFITLLNILSWTLELNRSNKVNFLWKYLHIHHNIYRRDKNPRSTKPRSSEKEFEMQSMDVQSTNSVTVHFSPSIPINKNEVKEFYNHYLQTNGVLMLHMIKSVAGEIVLMDLLVVLWEDYRKSVSTAHRQNDSNSISDDEETSPVDNEQA